MSGLKAVSPLLRAAFKGLRQALKIKAFKRKYTTKREIARKKDLNKTLYESKRAFQVKPYPKYSPNRKMAMKKRGLLRWKNTTIYRKGLKQIKKYRK